jgi:DNA-binding transcriptional MerR regulator
LLSSKEILDATEIKAGKTLTRWHQQGLIPPPTVDTHPNGRGKMAYWPDWVLERCKRIKQLVATGYSLEQIEQLLGKDWEDEEKRWQHRTERYRFSKVSSQLDFDAAARNFGVMVTDKLMKIYEVLKADTRKFLELEREIATGEMAERIHRMVVDGHNPVLVFDGESVVIVPDFLVSSRLSTPEGRQEGLLVASVFDEFVAAFGNVLPDMPDEPSIAPVQRVTERGHKETVEQAYQLVGLDDFEFETPKRTRRSRKRRRS